MAGTSVLYWCGMDHIRGNMILSKVISYCFLHHPYSQYTIMNDLWSNQYAEGDESVIITL